MQIQTYSCFLFDQNIFLRQFILPRDVSVFTAGMNFEWLGINYPRPYVRAYAGLHYQSFCDHSRNFARVNSTFGRIVRNV